jgi:hypothetical protein
LIESAAAELSLAVVLDDLLGVDGAFNGDLDEGAIVWYWFDSDRRNFTQDAAESTSYSFGH